MVSALQVGCFGGSTVRRFVLLFDSLLCVFQPTSSAVWVLMCCTVLA